MFTIRVKITLWIALASLISALGCSYYVYQEFLENVYLQVDGELAEVSETALYDLTEHHAKGDLDINLQGKFAFQHFLLALYDSDGKRVYANGVTELLEPSLHHTSTSYFITKILSAERFSRLQGEVSDLPGSHRGFVRFRVREFTTKVGEKELIIQVGKPVFNLYQELQELVTDLLVAIIVALLLIFAMGYWIAGWVLHPLVLSNRLVREISESSLDKRIPLGSQRDEIYELNSGLNSMFDRLEDSFRRQKEFMGSAAHELKSPLTVLMLGHEEMLSSELASPLYPELKRQLHSMQRLQKLIRDMLNIARLENEEGVRREKFSISQLLDTLLEDYAEYIALKRVTVRRRGGEVALFADKERITRLCINLLDNAIKYNREDGGSIEIAIAKEKEEVHLQICNSCAEINGYDLERIFDKFYRIEKSRSQEYGGAGLGLAIVQRIVQLHGGTIEAGYQQGVISFSLVFPCQGVEK